MDSLYCFEFDSSYFVRTYTVRADSYSDAINLVCSSLGEASMSQVLAIHKLMNCISREIRK